MKILAVEAAANVCSVALCEDARLLGEITVNNKKTHSQVLMPMLEELLLQCTTEFEEVDALFRTLFREEYYAMSVITPPGE